MEDIKDFLSMDNEKLSKPVDTIQVCNLYLLHDNFLSDI